MHFLKILWSQRDQLLLAAICLLLVLNIVKTTQKISSLIITRRNQPYVFTGDQFQGLKDILHHTTRIGYYTDKSLKNILIEAQFVQAQYVLAPVLLDLNALHHRFTIFDYEDSSTALEKIQQLGMVPLRRSSSGIILAQTAEHLQ